ncbi:hypothetical protein J2744_001682 [Halorubrum trapanicum]|uniref:Uncharacterized protein n=1 Tax=Halorubrum trapanicum TaxID=29284 RepID=A0A8J7UMD2_9EURY|nr:hypothetical protein [Halorubrum trapanicum]MBP1901999.1 hypothetical protein [Halorubrum trapanicum]
MRAREWAVAATSGDPTDYDVPALPTWRVERGEGGDVAFASADGDEPFIAAANPVRVRR